MTRQEYKQILERYNSAPILNSLEIDPEPSEKPDMFHVDAEGRKIGIEVTECWWDDVKLSQMDDYTMSACKEYELRLQARGEWGSWISVWFYDSVYKQLPNMSKKAFINAVCDEIDRHRKYDSVLDDPNITREDIKPLLSNKVFDYKYVCSISESRLNLSCVSVSLMQGTFVTTISETKIVEYVKKKDAKIADYRKDPKNVDLDAYWLFLTVPYRTFCGIDNLKMTLEIVSEYERIYVCDSMHVLQLK